VLPGKTYKPEDIVQMLWRRKWAVILPFVAVSLGTFAVSSWLPDRYRSETVILVVPQRVPEDYVRPTVTARIEDRLRTIQQQILTRTRLEQIIRDLKLYPREIARQPMEDVVELMRRRDVRVDIVKGDAFRVTYTYDNPKTAMDVAARLASEFQNESLSDRATQAQSTTHFLESQLISARKRLEAQEAKFADFQRRYSGQLPSEREANLQVLHNLQLQVQSVLESLNRDRDRRLFLERSMADLEPQAQAARTAVPVSPTDAATGGETKGSTAEQLEAARQTLKGLEIRLKPEHPDVTYMRRVIRDLEAKANAEASAQPPLLATARSSRPLSAEEAATMRRLQEVRQEIAAVDDQIASKQAEERRLRAEIDAFQRRLASTPALAAELTSLTRDYETVKKVYETLLAKQEESRVAAALEAGQIGEVFKVLDPARLPEAPFSPNRPLINLLGALAGLGIGLGLAMVLDYGDKALRTEDDVVSVLKVPVLASIPVIETSSDLQRARRRRRYSLLGAAAAALLLVAAGVAAWSSGALQLPLLFR